MPIITEEQPYNGALQRVARLGLTPIVSEVRSVLTGFTLLIKEEKDANGGAAVRRLVDSQFEKATGWVKKQSGDIDWTKCQVIDGSRVCVGVEIQLSARSDLIVVDLIHLRRATIDGQIDLGILVVPSDRLGRYLTDRGPKMADAKRHVAAARVEDLPLLLVAIEHDGPGAALAKQGKRSSAGSG